MSQWQLFDSFREYVGDGTIDLDDDSFTVGLLAATYSPDVANDTVLSDVVAYACSNVSSVSLTGVTWTRTGADVDWGADDAVFTAVGGAVSPDPRYAIVWDDSAGNKLVAYLDLGSLALAVGQRLRLDMSGVLS